MSYLNERNSVLRIPRKLQGSRLVNASESEQSCTFVDILIVEDDERTHAAMMKLVSRMGYAPRGACNYADAMEAVNQKAPQVLITDWDLGESKSGIDVAAEALAQRTNCKVVFCSGNSMSSLRSCTRHLKICRYIRKPISLTRLRTEFAMVLNEC